MQPIAIVRAAAETAHHTGSTTQRLRSIASTRVKPAAKHRQDHIFQTDCGPKNEGRSLWFAMRVMISTKCQSTGRVRHHALRQVVLAIGGQWPLHWCICQIISRVCEKLGRGLIIWPLVPLTADSHSYQSLPCPALLVDNTTWCLPVYMHSMIHHETLSLCLNSGSHGYGLPVTHISAHYRA